MDLDLDYSELGGNISWVSPLESAQVTEYYIYLGDSPEPAKMLGENGSFPWSGRSQLGVVPFFDTELFVPPETLRRGYGYVLVYASSSLAEQTTPAAHIIYDANASVSNVNFVGKDLDLEDLGGYVSWVEPASDLDRVMAYSVYLSLDDIGTGRSKVEQDVLVGSNELLVPPETPRQSFTRFVVYTRSTLVEQSTPTAHLLFDTTAMPQNLDFLDIDVDRGEMGGNLTWMAPTDPTHVTEYVLYLGENAHGLDRSILGNVSWDTFEFFVPLNTLILNFTHLLVYSKSDLAEMTTPAALLIRDSIAEVDNITLFDRDLDENEVGGEITWDPPTEERIVDKYRVFFQIDAAGTVKSQVDTDKPRGDLAVAFPGDTDITGMTWIGVWITAFGVEQQTPSVTQVVDTISSVGFVKFADEDLDALQLAGTISWGPPAEITYNQDYVIYFAQSETGTARSLVGVVPLGTNSLAVPLDTYFSQFTHFVVYTRSIAYEQSTPLGVQLYDHNGLVQNLAFSDNDLDENMLGGLLQWTLPADTSAVQQYNIYFTFTADQFDPLFRRDIVALGLSPSATHQMLPLGTSKISADGLEEVSCNLTAADAVLSVFYNGSDLSNYVTGTFSEWSNTKKFSFLKVPGAYLVISASSMLTADWCSPTENICVAGTFNQGLNYCSVAGFSLECSDGVTAGDIGWEAYGSSIDVDSLHQAGGGTGWSTTCASESNFYLIENSLSAKIWASAGLQHAAFRLLSGSLSPTRNETYSHFMVYAESTLAEQTTPAVLQIVDSIASVDYMRFVDEDLGLASIGGEVRWNPVGDIQLASAYSVYLATDSSGADRSLLGTSPVGTTVLTVPQGTLLTQNFTHVVIYVESFLVQQRLPAWSLFLVDEYEGLCESDVCGFGGGQPTRVGSCTTAAGCSDCDLNPLRIQTITTAIAGDMVLITTEAGTDVFNFWSKLSSCGVTILDVHYYKAIGPTTPSTTDTTVSFQCRFSCLPGADCQTCVAAEQGIVSGTTVDDDGYSVWRYLACAFRGLSNAADSELTYSYVFSKGVYLGSAAEAKPAEMNADRGK
ncbi:SAP domain-containing protein [Durusdinium trenchii]|uniref:SAP domain-containing protein n=1 Tax=Durusdinium trenchii TaxID=1381693 RepID=A0ABP0LMS2_9DINO